MFSYRQFTWFRVRAVNTVVERPIGLDTVTIYQPILLPENARYLDT